MPIDATSFLTRNKIIAFEKIFSNFQPITNSQRASRPPRKRSAGCPLPIRQDTERQAAICRHAPRPRGAEGAATP